MRKVKDFLLTVYDLLWVAGEMSGCHQLPERSFVVRGRQFPVCARCTGCFVGYVVGYLLYVWYQLPLWLCVTFCAVMFCDWLVQHLKVKESTNLRRFVTGLLCGTGYIQLVLWVICHIVTVVFY